MTAADWSRAPSRGQWFALAFLVLTINAAGTFPQAVDEAGWLGAAFNLFNVSAIIWIAAAAGTVLLWRDDGRLLAGDRPALALAAGALVPSPAVSGAALTLLAGWAIWRSPPAHTLRRGALVFLAIAASLLWGRVLLALFSGPLLAFDGVLAAVVGGTGGTGNLTRFSDGGVFVIAPGCSSLQGVSLAVVLWVAVTQFLAIHIDARARIVLAAAVAGAIVANALRLGSIARWPAHFKSLHVGGGAAAFGWLALALICAAIAWGFRHELAARR